MIYNCSARRYFHYISVFVPFASETMCYDEPNSITFVFLRVVSVVDVSYDTPLRTDCDSGRLAGKQKTLVTHKSTRVTIVLRHIKSFH